MRSLDLHQRILFTLLGLLLPSAALAVWAFGSHQASLLAQNQLASTKALVASFANACEDLLALGGEDALVRLLTDLQEEHSTIVKAEVLDARGQVLAGDPGGAVAAHTIPIPESIQSRWMDSEAGDVLEVEAPIRRNGAPMAVLRIQTEMPGHGELFRHSLKQAAEILLILLLAALLASHFLRRSIVRPLRDLDQAMMAIRRGDMAARATGRRQDEIGRIQRSFNLMADELQGTYAMLEAESAVLEGKVRQRTAQLAHKEALLRQIASKAPLAMLALGPEGVLFVNEEAARLLDADDPEEVSGFTAFRILRRVAGKARSPRRALETLKGMTRGETSEADLVLEDGSSLLLRTTEVRTREGELVGGLVLALDVSVERAREEELRRARDAAQDLAEAKSRFLANMSHEIRTPMNGVLGMTELLLETSLDNEQRDYAETVRRSGEALLTILNDILDFSKIEAGRIELEVIDFSLRDEVEDVVVLLMPRAAEKGIELLLDLHPEVPVHLRGDPVRLRQILMNLVSNAIKFTEEGEVLVRCRRTGEEAGGVRLRFEVRDTGIGIPREARNRLFHCFSQADASTTRRFGGTGLGLAISRSLVELMGGTIDVESEPGQGSLFWFEVVLPLGEGPERCATALQEIEGLKVLVVDDNATNGRILTLHLRHWGLEPLYARGPDEALDVARANPDIRLVLTDYEMPESNGLQFSRRLQELGLLDSAPRILLSSSAQPLDPSDLEAAGIQHTLNKPVRQISLLNAIASTLAGATLKEAEEALSRDHGPTPGPGGPGGRLLVAEDNPVNQKLAVRLLERLGYEVVVASNGREAVEKAAHGSWTAILMDCQMPVLDGYAATAEIRRSPGGRSIPIIAMTANALEGDREKCLAAGMDDYLTKPIRRQDLIEALQRWAKVA